MFYDAKSTFGPPRGGNHSHLRPQAMKIMLEQLMTYAPSPSVAFKQMAAEFERVCEGHDVKRPRRMLENLYARVKETGTWADRPRSGRPQQLTEDQVSLCIVVFKRGVGNRRDQNWYGYTSIEHAALLSPLIQRVLDASGVSVDTLWTRMCAAQMREHGKPFRKINIKVRPALRDDVKAERLEIARLWCRWELDDFKDIFWIDEKTEYVKNISYACYADDGEDSYMVESHSSLGTCKKLKYIACVNAVLGPVYFKLISGTSDFDSGFAVRTYVPLPRHFHPAVRRAALRPHEFDHAQQRGHVRLRDT